MNASDIPARFPVAFASSAGGSYIRAIPQAHVAASTTDAETLATIKQIYETAGVILDTHTAVGVKAAFTLKRELPAPIIMLGCAHPAKFPEAIQQALNLNVGAEKKLAQLLQKPERTTILSAEIQQVSEFISSKITK